jgi:hypothetical protein
MMKKVLLTLASLAVALNAQAFWMVRPGQPFSLGNGYVYSVHNINGQRDGDGFERIAAEIWITNQSKSPRKFSAYEIAIQVWDNSAQMTIDPESFT